MSAAHAPCAHPAARSTRGRSLASLSTARLALALLLSAVLLLPLPAWPAAAPQGFDAVLLLADEAPARLPAALAALPPAASAEQRREQALLRAWAGVRSDQRPETLAAPLAALAAAGAALAPALAEADAALLRALLVEREGRQAFDGLARQALAGYEGHCGAQQPVRADCEYRTRWQARQLLAQHASGQHATSAAHEQAQAAMELAAAGQDPRRQAWSECQMAMAAVGAGDSTRAGTHLDRARTLAGRAADTTLRQRLAITEALLARLQGQTGRAGRALQQMLALARTGGSARQQAVALANLADHAVKTGAPGQALRHAEQGLALLEGQAAAPVRSALLHNAMLARVALGRLPEARRDFDALQAAWGETGANGRQLSSLREYGDALAAAGDLKGALEMVHREQALAERLKAANRDTALAELRTRFDREAQQRRILLLERNNALTAAAVANQALIQRLWVAAGGVLALTALLMLLLVRRVRETRRRLKHHQASLRVQSETDALTGVASRRHAQTLLRAAGQRPGGLAGALLMIDIDRFKQINDGQGHAEGDRVLAETARRIAAVLRPQDLVARWGGEEFLVHADGLDADEARALAGRLLHAVAGTPVALGNGRSLRVTVSIGHGVFPLAPHGLAVTPEQAINLADMALYTAKGQGRHRAVGIAACGATTAEALQAVEADFERAWQDGRVGLHIECGPGPALDIGSTAAPDGAAPPVAAAAAAPQPDIAGAH